MNSSTRRAVAALLAIAGVAAVVCGVGAWMISGCCGSSEPPQDGYLALGALGGLTLWTGAYWTLGRGHRR